MRVRIYPLALGKVVKHALVNPDKEVAGLLVGKVNGQVLEIWDARVSNVVHRPSFISMRRSWPR